VRFLLFLTSFELTMTCPFFEHNLVIYLITVAARAIELFLISSNRADQDVQIFSVATNIINITHPVHLTLSMVVNIFATFIITLKAWCVRVYGVFGKCFVKCTYIDDATCAYIQEIPQVADRKRDRYPNS
jgi:hypothetical protein